MVGWHHQLDGREFGWTLGGGDGQRGLACCGSWGLKESDMTEQLNWTDQRCGEVPAPRRCWSTGGHCHGTGRKGRCQGVLGKPWLAQVPSTWWPGGAEAVTGPQSGLQSSKGLCVLWFVATAEAGGPPCSLTPTFWITCADGSPEWISWAAEKEETIPQHASQEEPLSAGCVPLAPSTGRE